MTDAIYDERPWGNYTVLSDEDDHKVKRLVVHPGKRLSYQTHARRAEHWFVVSGTATVTLDGELVEIGSGQSVDIGLGTAHRVANEAADDLVFIEVQIGDYFEEDDIVRLEDDFGGVDLSIADSLGRVTATMKANDLCFCGSGRKFKRCHKASFEPIRPGRIAEIRPVPDHIELPSYVVEGEVVRWDEPLVKSDDIVARMRRTGADAAKVLAAVGAAAQPGVTTDELDRLCHETTIELGAYPSPLLYGGSDNPFPKSICSSLNEVICHGIPDDRELQDGDILNLDVTIFREGVHGDTNRTFLIGTVDEASQRLVQVTLESLERAIDAVAPGQPFNVIGTAIESHAEPQGYGVVRAFVGHGIGEQFHANLHVPHYYDPRLTMPMEPGMTFTIEPMITMGSVEPQLWADGWTATTIDRKRTAQFEHTILVTDDGAEVLTPWPDA